MHESLLSLLQKHLPSAKAELVKKEAGDQSIVVQSAVIHEVCLFLRDLPSFEFQVLQVITGCDYPPDRIEVSYILASYKNNLELILKTHLPRQNPSLYSVHDVWKAALFQERECFDMLGVIFHNHPDLRRILCPDDWEGYPLRKDYQAAEEYRGMKIYPADKMNFPEREFAKKQKQGSSDSGAEIEQDNH
jgi:NADH-quinone oxidoreductase subunit C